MTLDNLPNGFLLLRDSHWQKENVTFQKNEEVTGGDIHGQGSTFQ